MSDSPIATPPDDRLSENLLWHHQISPNGGVQFELNLAGKVHAAFGQVGRFNGVFPGTTFVKPANSDGDVEIKAKRRSAVRIHGPSAKTVVEHGRGDSRLLRTLAQNCPKEHTVQIQK